MEEKEKIEQKASNIEKKKFGVNQIINTTIKSVLNLLYLVLTIIVIILIYNIIQVSILNKPYMDIFGYSFFEVKTGSMSGTIEIGDIIIVKLTNDVKQNDIVTFEQEDILVTHRIIEKQGEEIITKGDANNTEDDPIKLDDIIGKVVYTLKDVEIWKKVFKTPEVYTLIIITLILFGITISIKDDKKE